MSIFTQVKVKKRRKTKFNLSHSKKLSTSMGKITPIGLMEVMPGDSFRWSSELLIKMSPLVVPTFERFTATVHYFFVPNRIVWTNWEDFITGGEDGTSTPEHPYMPIKDTDYNTKFGYKSLADYFGIPPQDTWTPGFEEKVNALPFRGYMTIYNEYYRDQNLTPKAVVSVEDGRDLSTDAIIRTRAWSKDYFTSALPWAQRGGEVVLPVETDFTPLYKDPATTGQSPIADGDPLTVSQSSGQNEISVSGQATTIENLQAQTLQGSSVSINELRKAYRLQEWLEANARGGARYVEQILGHFGVRFSDYRAQRPIFLGSGKSDVLVSEILNTTGIQTASDPANGNVQAGYAGNAMTVGRTNGFKHSFQEHGFIHALLTVQPTRATYFQGISRIWNKEIKLDYPFPEFANLGEQEILNKELFFEANSLTGNESTFGYTPRYAEYKEGSVYTSISGDFRTNLDVWHYARKFDTRPALNTDFVTYSNDKRIFNILDPSEDTLYVNVLNKITAIRPLPYFGTPRT